MVLGRNQPHASFDVREMHFVRAVLLKAFICLANLAMFLLELEYFKDELTRAPVWEERVRILKGENLGEVSEIRS